MQQEVCIVFQRIYVDQNLVLGEKSTHIENSPLELVALDLRYHGGTVTESVERDITHVIVNSG